MNFGAADLVKRSAKQLVYLALKGADVTPTEQQKQGNQYAAKITGAIKNASEEKRGHIVINDMNLYFTVDMAVDNRFIEIKMVNSPNPPDWYRNSSLVQAAFYADLLRHVTYLDTPVFRLKEGYAQEIIPVPDERSFELWFGEETYLVQPNPSLAYHYFTKMNLVKNCIRKQDYMLAEAYDNMYKHKEFDLFNIKYKEIKRDVAVERITDIGLNNLPTESDDEHLPF
jgi:hypothetical protein